MKAQLERLKAKAAPFFKRVYSSRRSTIARLFVFTLCVSAITALSVNSRHESPKEQSVASSSLPVKTEDVGLSANVGDLDSSRIEAIDLTVDEAVSMSETETLANETLADIQPDEQEEIASSDADVSEEEPVVATIPRENEKEVAGVELCATNASFELRTGSISEIQIGYRVPGTNPEGNDGSDEAAFASEDLYIFTFRVPKSDGTFCKAKLLRSANWLLEQPSRCVSVFDGHEFNEIDASISDQSPYYFDWNFQFEVWIDLSGFGCVGWSKIVEIDDAFKYAPGEGNLVTGTFEHVAQDVIDLQIEGQEKPIGCTPTHPIWSVDREEFVPAGELVEGERVRVLNGDTKRVVQKLPRPGPEVVYNLEVFGEHVYHVTSDGVLVHNDCPENIVESTDKYDVVLHEGVYYFYQKNSSLEPIIVGKYGLLRDMDKSTIFGDQAHHVVRKRILELLGKNADDGISVFLTKKMHYKTRTYGRSNWPKDTDIDPVQELNDDIDNLRNLFNDEQFFNVDEKYDSTLIESVLNKIKKLNEDANINGWGQVSTSKPTLPKP